VTIKSRLEKRCIDRRTEPVTIRLNASTLDALDEIACKHRLSRNAVIGDFVMVALGQYQQEFCKE